MEPKKTYCSPDKLSNDGTCYSKDDLLLLAHLYNRHQPSNNKIIVGNKSKRSLWNALNTRLRDDCNREWCWLERNFVPAPYAKVMMEKTFRPKMPDKWKKNPFTWLNTLDIRNVMKQYEKKYPSFLFIGPVPIDCPSRITCALSNLKVHKLVNKVKKTKLGVIYNLDPHNKPGSHWVGLYSDFNEPMIAYFDSVGLPPPKLIRSFIMSLKKSIEDYWERDKKRKRDVVVWINRTRFQFGSSECGVFSIFFILDHLRGRGLKGVKQKELNDKKMNQLRKEYFRPE